MDQPSTAAPLRSSRSQSIGSLSSTEWINVRVHAVGLATLTLLYYDFVMIQSYITPFFWAFMICLFLKRGRDKIVNFLDGFVPGDEEQTDEEER